MKQPKKERRKLQPFPSQILLFSAIITPFLNPMRRRIISGHGAFPSRRPKILIFAIKRDGSASRLSGTGSASSLNGGLSRQPRNLSCVNHQVQNRCSTTKTHFPCPTRRSSSPSRGAERV